MQEKVLFLAADVESLVLGDDVVGSALELVVALGGDGVGEFLLKLVFCLLDLVLDLLVVLPGLLLVLELELEHGLAHLEASDGAVLPVAQTRQLLLLDDLLDALQFPPDVRRQLVHLEGRDHRPPAYPLYAELVELEHVDEVVFQFVLLGLRVGLLPRQLLPGLLFLLVNALLEGLGVLGIDYHLLGGESGQMVAFSPVGLHYFLEQTLQFLYFLVFPALDLLRVAQLHIFLRLQLLVLQAVDGVVQQVFVCLHPQIDFV